MTLSARQRARTSGECRRLDVEFALERKTTLPVRIYKNKDLKSSPAQLFALISEASKWSLVLKDVIERCGLLAEEKKVGSWAFATL